MPEPLQVNIKIDDNIAKGVHAQDVAVTVTPADISLTFYVRDPAGTQGIATARVFIPHITAVQLSQLLQKFLAPTYEKYLDMVNKLPPSSGGTEAPPR